MGFPYSMEKTGISAKSKDQLKHGTEVLLPLHGSGEMLTKSHDTRDNTYQLLLCIIVCINIIININICIRVRELKYRVHTYNMG